MSLNKAVFLDKDGTLVKNIAFNTDTKKIKFYEGVEGGLRILGRAKYKLIIVTNQPGPALGIYSLKDIDKVKNFIFNFLGRKQIVFSGYYFCPHHPYGKVKEFKVKCGCRKPMSGLLRKAGNQLNIDLNKSWMIGDTLDDMEAGNRCGCKTILVDNGNETEWKISLRRSPLAMVNNFMEAADLILKSKNGKNLG